jgi:hypothetical protein
MTLLWDDNDRCGNARRLTDSDLSVLLVMTALTELCINVIYQLPSTGQQTPFRDVSRHLTSSRLLPRPAWLELFEVLEGELGDADDAISPSETTRMLYCHTREDYPDVDRTLICRRCQ